MKKLVLAVLCVACGMAVFGQETGPFEIRDKTLVRYTGDGGSVVIPPGITAIGGGAFFGCSSLTSVSILSSVTSIAEGAFSGCSSLKAIDVQPENRWYKDINGVLFTKDGKTLHSYPAGREGAVYTIPSGVTAIRDLAFSHCNNLTSVSIPPSVTSIGVGAFFGCSSLASVSIPSSVTSIGGMAFYGCSSLMAIELSRHTRIGEDAFDEVPGSLRYRD
jgi:hypothetical protein